MKRFLYILFALSLSACGTLQTSVRVKNSADGTSTEITINNGDGGSTSVQVSPKITLTDQQAERLKSNVR